MKILRQKKQYVDETTLGVYVWLMPDGRWIGDDDGNYLSVPSRKGNRTRIDELAREVRSYGIYEGSPHFLAGSRKITDEEFQEQEDRLKWGLIPDPLDIGNYKDGARQGRVI
ncbi:MAG: hypothetical protein EBY12_01535 [Actinobacteria bacterium]|jgi:hypothetical protein|nr:hypothetical protein [Actinomycetota bacterium]